MPQEECIVTCGFLFISKGLGHMINESTLLKKEIDYFQVSTGKLSQKINGVGNLWQDKNYITLQKQINELAKMSRVVLENGSRASKSISLFITTANEDVR